MVLVLVKIKKNHTGENNLTAILFKDRVEFNLIYFFELAVVGL